MKFLFLIVATLAVVSMADAQCTTLTCSYNNVFNSQACRCDCFPNYSGNLCQNLDCTRKDPDQCAAFGAYNCVVSFIKGYCPHMCGTCVASTTTTTTASTTTTTAGSTTTGTTTTGASTTTTTAGSTTTGTTTTGASTTTTTAGTTTTGSTTTGASTTTTTAGTTTTGSTTTGASTTTTTAGSTTTGSTTTGASTTTTTAGSTTTGSTTTGATTTACPVVCLNGGVVQNCACTCPSAFTGTICQTINCANKADAASCIFFQVSSCTTTGVPALCPTLCGLAAACP